MEKCKTALAEAKHYLKIADHMLIITYPLVKDPKIMVAVIENIFLSFTKAMGAILYYERYNKRIPPFHETFESKFNMFRLKIVNKYKIKKDYVKLIEDIKSIILEHKKSPIEFIRKELFVICSKDYKVSTLSVKSMKTYVSKAKLFIADISNLIDTK